MGVSVLNNEHRRVFTDVSFTLHLAAADTPTTVGANIIAGKSKHTIFIQRIAVHVKTAAAQAITFTDDAGSPKIVAVLPASAAVGPEHVLIDHEEGVALTEDANFDITGAAGVAATITVLAYRRLTGVITADSFKSV